MRKGFFSRWSVFFFLEHVALLRLSRWRRAAPDRSFSAAAPAVRRNAPCCGRLRAAAERPQRVAIGPLCRRARVTRPPHNGRRHSKAVRHPPPKAAPRTVLVRRRIHAAVKAAAADEIGAPPLAAVGTTAAAFAAAVADLATTTAVRAARAYRDAQGGRGGTPVGALLAAVSTSLAIATTLPTPLAVRAIMITLSERFLIVWPRVRVGAICLCVRDLFRSKVLVGRYR